MKVILLTELRGKGGEGDIIDVALAALAADLFQKDYFHEMLLSGAN